eukprot:15480972-Alexandrium_andersonii.AAC.1
MAACQSGCWTKGHAQIACRLPCRADAVLRPPQFTDAGHLSCAVSAPGCRTYSHSGCISAEVTGRMAALQEVAWVSHACRQAGYGAADEPTDGRA